MPDSEDILIRLLTEMLPANTAAAKALRIAFDDGTDTDELGETKQNTIGAVFDLIYALRGLATASNLTQNPSRILGRTTAGLGAIEEIQITDGLLLSAGALRAEVTTAIMEAAISAAVTGLFELKGGIACNTNPNYPAASKGDAYRVTTAGKIGGASGKTVDVGDWIICLTDNAGGTEAAVGSSWEAWEGNIPGLTADGLALITAANYAAMKTLLGLNNVTNTSDANKPVSTAQQTALNLKANLASPVFTGVPTVPTQVPATNGTVIINAAYASQSLLRKDLIVNSTTSERRIMAKATGTWVTIPIRLVADGSELEVTDYSLVRLPAGFRLMGADIVFNQFAYDGSSDFQAQLDIDGVTTIGSVSGPIPDLVVRFNPGGGGGYTIYQGQELRLNMQIWYPQGYSSGVAKGGVMWLRGFWEDQL